MNTRPGFPRAKHRSSRPTSTSNPVTRAPSCGALSVCVAVLLSTGCGNDSESASNSATTAEPSGGGSQSATAPNVPTEPAVSLGGTAPMNSTTASPSTERSSGGMTVSTASTSTEGTPEDPIGSGSSGGPATTPGEVGGGGAGGVASTKGSGGSAAGAAASGGEAGASGGSTGDGSEAGEDVSEDATFVPDPEWACGMPGGIPSPMQGELAFTIELEISAEHEVGNTPYGYRRLLDVSGGTIAGDRLQGSVLTGGLEYELTLSNGVMEYQGINILETSAGRIFVRSCGVAPDEGAIPRVVFDFEASTNGGNAFLNDGTWVATRDVASGTMTLAVYDVSDVTAGEPRVEIVKPEGVLPQPWECNTTSGSQGAEVFTENVSLGGSFSINNAKYGTRNVIPITGGTTSGRVNGAILNGGADYQLSGSLDAWYTLAPDNGEFILVRNCGGANGLIPWFEAAVDGEFDFLNTQAYLSSPPGVGAGGVSITFYERN